jgi:hypothetical protein
MATKEDVMQDYVRQLTDLGVSIDMDTLEMAFNACGPANYKEDSMYVAASDKTELERVYKNFVSDELGINDEEKGMAMIHAVAEKMSSERMKYRAVFYYLLAKMK